MRVLGECPGRMGLSICKNCSTAVFTDMLCIDVRIDQSPFSCKCRWKKTSDFELQPLPSLSVTGARSHLTNLKTKKTCKHVCMYVSADMSCGGDAQFLCVRRWEKPSDSNQPRSGTRSRWDKPSGPHAQRLARHANSHA